MKPLLFFELTLKGVFFLSCFLFIFFSLAIAQTTIEINSYPAQVNKLQEFEAGFTVQLEAASEYYYKERVGQGSSLNKAETFNGEWLGDSDAWSKFPILKTNDTGSFSGNVKLRIKDTALEGENKLILRVRKVGTDNNLDSSEKNLIVNPSLEITSPSPSIGSSQPSVSAKSTCKINDVKKDGGTLTSVKIYIDGTYTGHYAPETFNFCDGCKDGGFGNHQIKLEKSGYRDFNETKNFKAGDNYELNPQLVLLEPSSEPSSSVKASASPSVISSSILPTPEIKLTAQKESTKSIEINLLSPLASTQSAVLGQETQQKAEKPILIPVVLSSLGVGLMGLAFTPKLLAHIRQK